MLFQICTELQKRFLGSDILVNVIYRYLQKDHDTLRQINQSRNVHVGVSSKGCMRHVIFTAKYC